MNKSVAFIVNPQSSFGQTGWRMKAIIKEIKHSVLMQRLWKPLPANKLETNN